MAKRHKWRVTAVPRFGGLCCVCWEESNLVHPQAIAGFDFDLNGHVCEPCLLALRDAERALSESGYFLTEC